MVPGGRTSQFPPSKRYGPFSKRLAFRKRATASFFCLKTRRSRKNSTECQRSRVMTACESSFVRLASRASRRRRPDSFGTSRYSSVAGLLLPTFQCTVATALSGSRMFLPSQRNPTTLFPASTSSVFSRSTEKCTFRNTKRSEELVKLGGPRFPVCTASMKEGAGDGPADLQVYVRGAWRFGLLFDSER